MYSSASLGRLKDYLLAVIYMQRKDQHKSAVIEQKIETKLNAELPKAVHSGNTEQVDKLVDAVVTELHISADKSKAILHNNFLPVLRLIETARKKVNDRQTLLRYLNVISHVDGTDLAKISKELGKDKTYLHDLVINHGYEDVRDALIKSVNAFGVSTNVMKDAVSRCQIRAEHKSKATVKPKVDTKDFIHMDYSSDFMARFEAMQKKKFIPDNFTGLIKKFLHNLRHRKYSVTKGATKAYVHVIQLDTNSLFDLHTKEAVKYLHKIYPEKKPKRLMFAPKAYAKERKQVTEKLKDAENPNDEFTIAKNRMRVTLNNGTYLNVYVYNFNWENLVKEMDATVCLLCYVNPKMTAKRRRLLKRFSKSNAHYI